MIYIKSLMVMIQLFLLASYLIEDTKEILFINILMGLVMIFVMLNED